MSGHEPGADAGDPSGDPADAPSDGPADPGPWPGPGRDAPAAGPGSGPPASGPGWGPPGPRSNPAWGPPASGPGWGPPASGPGWGPPASGPGSGWGSLEAPYGWGSWQGVPPPGPGPAAAPRPGLVPLRPLSLGDILDGALQAIRRHPRAMIGLPAAVGGAALVLSLLLRVVPAVARLTAALAAAQRVGSAERDGTGDRFSVVFAGVRAGDVVTTVVLALVLGLLYAVASQAVYACLVQVVADGVLGRHRTVRGAWSTVRGRVPRLIGVVVVEALANLAVVLVVGGLATAGVVGAVAGLHGGVRILVVALVGVVGVAALAVSSVFLYVRWSLAPVVLVLDGVFPVRTSAGRPGIGGALGGSWRLVRGSWWRVLGITLLVGLIAGIVANVVSIPFSLVGAAVTAASSIRSGATGFGSSGLAGLGSLVGAALVLPFTVACLTLLYLDLRMRRGLDLVAALDTPSPGDSSWEPRGPGSA